MKNLQNNAFCSAFTGPSVKVGDEQRALWTLHFFEIILLPQGVSRKFACVSLSKTSKILLLPSVHIPVGDPDVN